MGGEEFKAKEGLIIINIVNQKKDGAGKTTIAGMLVRGGLLRQIKLIMVLVMVVMLILPGMVWGFGPEVVAKETLRGIKGVGVLVEDINPEIEKDGLTKRQIQTDVELKLRLAGLNVLSSKERLKTPGMPRIGVFVHIIKSSLNVYVYDVTLALSQNVYLERNNKWSVAITWAEAGHFGTARKFDSIRNITKDQVDVFLNEWLSVNPKI